MSSHFMQTSLGIMSQSTNKQYVDYLIMFTSDAWFGSSYFFDLLTEKFEYLSCIRLCINISASAEPRNTSSVGKRISVEYFYLRDPPHPLQHFQNRRLSVHNELALEKLQKEKKLMHYIILKIVVEHSIRLTSKVLFIVFKNRIVAQGRR